MSTLSEERTRIGLWRRSVAPPIGSAKRLIEESDMDVHRSIDISASPERVWPFLVEPDKVVHWYTTLSDFEYIRDRRGPGAHVHLEERAPGGMIKGDFEASEWVEPQRIALHMTSGTMVRAYDQRWSLEPTPDGCRFTFDEHVELPYGAVGRLIGAIGRRSSERHLAEMLAALKHQAEA